MANDDDSEIRAAIEELTTSFSSVRQVIKALRQNREALDTKDGISLLSVKNYTLLSYLQCLLLLSSKRILGESLDSRSPPPQPFSSLDRSSRGSNAGDLVDSMIESRIVLEKVKILETKLRYQIDKLVRLAEQPESSSNVIDDPLSFRPNPKNFMQPNGQEEHSDTEHPISVNDDTTTHDSIYRPPRVAPAPYTESSKSKSKSRDAPAPRALASLVLSDPSRPHAESTSGMGSTPALLSGRANYLKRLNEFEEDNFTRVVMKKTDARRRLRDEEDLALGGDLGAGAGAGAGKGRRPRAGGLEDEFGDVLRSIQRGGGGGGGVVGGKGIGDGYDELRKRGKKADVLERSRRSDGVRKRGGESEEIDEGPARSRKRTRFELDTKAAKKRLSKKKKSSNY